MRIERAHQCRCNGRPIAPNRLTLNLNTEDHRFSLPRLESRTDDVVGKYKDYIYRPYKLTNEGEEKTKPMGQVGTEPTTPRPKRAGSVVPQMKPEEVR